MKWDVFRPREKAKGDPVAEAIEQKEKAIEKFAPREYRSERERFYYNYRMVPLYRVALSTFLEIIAKNGQLKEDPISHARDLFVTLRNFYDPRRKASSEIIAQDPAFRKKFREVYRYFYNRSCPPFEEIADWFLKDQ